MTNKKKSDKKFWIRLVCLIMAFMGITVTRMTPEEQAKADAGELV